MDKFDQHVKDMYESGLRACIIEGDVHCYTYYHHKTYMPVDSPPFWQALRTYQDEHRKKGVPIQWTGVDAEWNVINRWLNTDYEIDGNLYRYNVSGRLQRDIKCPEIIVFGKDRYRTGQFTNFRWRDSIRTL